MQEKDFVESFKKSNEALESNPLMTPLEDAYEVGLLFNFIFGHFIFNLIVRQRKFISNFYSIEGRFLNIKLIEFN